MSEVKDLEKIKRKLLLRKQELDNKLSILYKDAVPLNDQIQDVGDQAIATTLEELNISIHNNELAEYKMIVNALKKIDDGTYGICTECGKPISEKRLALFPNAERCLSCQEALESDY